MAACRVTGCILSSSRSASQPARVGSTRKPIRSGLVSWQHSGRREAKPRTADGEPSASSQKGVVQSRTEKSSRTNVTNEDTTIVPATSSNNAPSIVVTERAAQNSTSIESEKVSAAVAVDALTTLPQKVSTAAAMAQGADHKLPTATSKGEDESTPVTTVQNVSSNATAQRSSRTQNSFLEDLPSQAVNDVAVTGSSGSPTTRKIVTSAIEPTVFPMAQSSARQERATTLLGMEEVTTSLRTLTKQHETSSNPTVAPKLSDAHLETKTTSSSVTAQDTATAKQVTPLPPREVVRNTSSSLLSRPAPAVAAMTNISEGEEHRKFSPPTRRTTAPPSGTTPNVVVAKHQHLGRAGLNLPTRKTTPGAPGSTHKPHIGRAGTRAPFGIIGSTRRTTLGTKATIRPLTKIFDRARTRPHTKATTPRPNRGPRMRITTGKPTRKGFPIGPKPTSGNETNFDLDAYTRLLHVTRRPPRPPEPTWRTTFFNLTDPTPAPNEVEAPVIRVAGIAKIVEGWEWSPLLGDHNTHEYRYLSYTIRRMLTSIFRKTTEGRYFYRVDIDGFSPGSVIVDYFVLFYQRGGPVDPMELASAFNSQLGVNGSLGEDFFLDPTYTQFEVVGLVRPKPLASSSAEPPVPQWAIAVIVIATASLIFIVLFGAVTIYGRTAERRKYSNRLQDDDLENVTPSPSKDWESKLAASYENFAADSVYDTEDLRSPPPSHDPFQYDDRYKAW
ncbi:hypothetical protein HPB51_011316 [Rhipicephalus microplus]|uniref:SEA domain-containing protein n=1 Tax=Rhipicephalus microplus TaxID=6941 RepID=A0A9J6DMY6_RHIMP|nr:hypothetical protein HPB51_011316 [Rhipicephalus microplus]